MGIKIFVCCHRPVKVPEHPLLVPLQVGAALAEKHFPGYLHDDVGDHISDRNRSYCELTGLYWVWKNVEADHYGFFHYRRYLYPALDEKRPYRIEKGPSSALLERLGFSRFGSLIPHYDLILPKRENMYVPVREHYAGAPFHRREDLELAERILLDQYPEYKAAADSYLSGTMNYFGNMFIMKRQVFHDYCGWLFPILEEFDRRADTSVYGVQERRVDGYLAERLLGIYQMYHRKLRMLEVPKVHFTPNWAGRYKDRAICAIFPPGTKRRKWAKQVKG